jgi:hypothetical protein
MTEIMTKRLVEAKFVDSSVHSDSSQYLTKSFVLQKKDLGKKFFIKSCRFLIKKWRPLNYFGRSINEKVRTLTYLLFMSYQKPPLYGVYRNGTAIAPVNYSTNAKLVMKLKR